MFFTQSKTSHSTFCGKVFFEELIYSPTLSQYYDTVQVDAMGAGINKTDHRTMDVPEGPLLAVQNFTFQLVTLLVHLALCLCLHEDELPFAREHFLEPSKVLCFIVCKFQPCLVLHSSLAQVHGCQHTDTHMSERLTKGYISFLK